MHTYRIKQTKWTFSIPLCLCSTRRLAGFIHVHCRHQDFLSILRVSYVGSRWFRCVKSYWYKRTTKKT
jgi:hypothetical protein